MTKAKKKVLTVLGEMQKRPVETLENVVAFLSSLSNDFANRYDIQNRVVVVSGARKVIAKYKMLEIVQAKIEVIEHKVKEVIRLFKPLVDRGIPFFWEEKGPGSIRGSAEKTYGNNGKCYCFPKILIRRFGQSVRYPKQGCCCLQV